MGDRSKSRTQQTTRRTYRRSLFQRRWFIVALYAAPLVALLSLYAAADLALPPSGEVHYGRSVRQWVYLLGAKDPVIRKQAFDALTAIGHEALPQLRHALVSDEKQRRRDALMVLRKIRPKDRSTAEALARAMVDKDVWVRLHAAETLEVMGPDAKPVVIELAAALKDDDPRVRRVAANCLGNLGSSAIIAHPALIKAMYDEELYVRHAASRAVSKITAEKKP